MSYHTYDNLYIEPRPDHWLLKNKYKKWTAEEVEDFLELHCGKDVIRPCGSQIMMISAKVEEKRTPSGIIIPELVEEEKKRQTSIGLVLDFGPDAYLDKNLFPSGPRCYRGDWVIYYKYERRTIKIKHNGQFKELITCFDDKILHRVEDPSYVDSTPLE